MTSFIHVFIFAFCTITTVLAQIDALDRSVCPFGVVTLELSTFIHQYPVFINQFFQFNIVINIDGLRINITNAPTSVSATFMATSTSIETSVKTPTQTDSPFPTFFLQVITPLLKRQSGSSDFIRTSGNSTSECSHAEQYSLSGGELFVGNKPISTNPGVPNISFLPLDDIGLISKTFSIDSSGRLQWTNPNFGGSKAAFVILQSRDLGIVFDGVLPIGSTIVDLVLADAALCPTSIPSSTSSTTQTSLSLTTSQTAPFTLLPMISSSTTLTISTYSKTSINSDIALSSSSSPPSSSSSPGLISSSSSSATPSSPIAAVTSTISTSSTFSSYGPPSTSSSQSSSMDVTTTTTSSVVSPSSSSSMILGTQVTCPASAPYAVQTNDPQPPASAECYQQTTGDVGSEFLIGTFPVEPDTQYCATLCLTNSFCQSFAFDSTTVNSCKLYSASVADSMASLNSPTNQIDVFDYYDSACYVCSPTRSCGCAIRNPSPPAAADCSGDTIIDETAAAPFTLYSTYLFSNEGCASLCFEKSGCLSFSTENKNGGFHCFVYASPLNTVAALAGSPWDGTSVDANRIYDPACYLCSEDNHHALCPGQQR